MVKGRVTRQAVLIAAAIVLPHVAAAQRSRQPITGVVVSAGTDAPLPGVDVVIRSLGTATATNDRGEFRVDSVSDGMCVLTFRKVGYAALDTSVTISTANRHILVRLRTIQQLDTVATETAAMPTSYLEHKAIGLGTFIDAGALRQQDGRALADVVRGMRGIALLSGPGNRQWLSSRRSTTSSGVYFAKADDIARGIRSACYAQVYLDNMLMNAGSPTPPFDVNTIQVETLRGVEYYAGPSETPNKYSRLNNACGVLVLWTRQ
jgi:hypothetical protein